MLLQQSCSTNNPLDNNYPNDPSISNQKGVSYESNVMYYPDSIKNDSIYYGGEPSFLMKWFSRVLTLAKEPILFNSYLEEDIYRLLWLRSFDRPIIISIHKKGNNIWLNTKALDKIPEFEDLIQTVEFKPPTNAKNHEKNNKVNTSQVLEKNVSKSNVKIEVNNHQTLTIKDWKEFEQLLTNCNFWEMQPNKEINGLDGSEWIIEGHLKEKYKFVARRSPKNNFRIAGQFLIQKSKLPDEIY